MNKKKPRKGLFLVLILLPVAAAVAAVDLFV